MPPGWNASPHHWHVEVQEEGDTRRVTVRERGLAEQEARLEGQPQKSWQVKRTVKVVACWQRCLGAL